MIINLISNNTNRDLTLTRLAVIWEWFYEYSGY
jgi:hypothetical protein